MGHLRAANYLHAFATHSQELLRDGHRLWFDPGMTVVHDEMDEGSVREIRTLMGESLILSRRLDPRHPYAWLVRLGYASIPIFVVAKSALTTVRIARRRAAHGVRWFEVPVAAGVGFVRHLLEVPGMIMAFRGRPVRAIHFR